MTAVFLDFATVGADEMDVGPLESALGTEPCSLKIYKHTAADQIIARVSNCEFLFTNKSPITREVIEAANKLRFIGLIATGVDNVDLDAARENNIAVCNIRGYCTNSVVEHVFGVLLHLTRSIGRYDERVRKGAWQQADDFCMLDFPIRELAAMTLGIVGYGVLGKGVWAVAEAFGMRVLVCGRDSRVSAAGETRVELPELLASCDVISLHCPLNADTQGMLGEKELTLMKQDAILINTARGGLVDSTALVRALENGDIGAAAIDVLAQEPPVDGDPLLAYTGKNLLLTPHIAWATKDARQNAISEVAANVTAFLNGTSRNRVV